MRHYLRRLPHRDVPEVPVFVTWCLHGSLAPERVFHKEHLTSGEAFVAWDRLLGTARSVAACLRQPEIAGMVAEQLKAVASNGFCSLHAYVVMPNHVHVLWTPAISLPDLVRPAKGVTACKANRLLSRSGQPFWQEEYFDRMVRSEDEFVSTKRYIELNPVRAGLTARTEGFPWRG